MLHSPADIEADLERIGANAFCADVRAIARDAIGLLTPPDRVSTVDCAVKHRKVRNPEGTGARGYSADLTPYMRGPQDALDDPDVRQVIVPGPGRTGKSVGGENFLFKRLRHGPLTDAIFYLPGSTDIESYADKEFADLFSPELHPEIAAKVGKRATDNKRTLKRVSGRVVQLLAASPVNLRQRQAAFIAVTEVDGCRPKVRDALPELVDIRGRAFGNVRKSYLESHPDAGWAGGITLAWRQSTRGIWYWPCPHCGEVSSPCPTAQWRMEFRYDRLKSASENEALAHAAKTAHLSCPHCGGVITDEHKSAMLNAGVWVHEGQTIDVDGTITGTVTPNERWGFWIHGTMSPFVTFGQLAREHLSATMHFESTGKDEKLREVTAKSLGEWYLGADDTNKGLNADALRRRLSGAGYNVGEVPAGVRFLTATVDVQGNRFETLVMGWDETGQGWIVDRFAILGDAKGRSLKPGLRQEDWELLRSGVLELVYPLRDKPGYGLGIASMGYDTGGVPGVTAKAREFARRMRRGPCAGANGYRLRPLKGAASKKAPEIPLKPREVNRTDDGKAIVPAVLEYDLGVHELKKTVAAYLAVETPGPGYIHFPADLDPQYVAELTNERYDTTDEEWKRHGANETWDLLVYGEAVRQMLKPERPTIRWDDAPPVWAKPVPLATDDDVDEAEPTEAAPAAPAKKRSLFERLDGLNEDEG